MAVAVYLVLIAFIIPIEHLAFADRPELLRRAVGIGTVMGLALIPVYFGGLDLTTWGMLLGGFVLAGGALAGMTWVERRKGRAARIEQARGIVHDVIRRFHTEAD